MVTNERRATELRDAFNSIVSHEMRTPITAIYGGAKLLARRDRQLDDATKQELIDDLEAEADRLYRLVEDLLVLSRSRKGSIERIDDRRCCCRASVRRVVAEQARWPGAKFEFTSTHRIRTATRRRDIRRAGLAQPAQQRREVQPHRRDGRSRSSTRRPTGSGCASSTGRRHHRR